MTVTQKKFRDTRTGEVVTEFPLLEIAYYIEVTDAVAAYADILDARRDRLGNAADRADADSKAARESSDRAVAGIPFGQPVLVGHHSERRHRNALNRSHKAMGRSIARGQDADDYRSRAASVGRAGISSDDPEAITKLLAKIDAAQEIQERMKAANKIIKSKKLSPDAKMARLADYGLKTRKLLEPDFCGRIGFPSYALQNNNANIRRMKARVEELRRAPTESSEYTRHGVRVVENADENRIQLFFDGKPSAEVRTILKGQGFRWSRFNMAWQRHLNSAGKMAADWALTQIAKA